MPFTPVHMGPGILFKSVLQGSFSLMVFGWTQILMDIQPLVVMLTGTGHMHGFSHTYTGATLVALVAAMTGKYLAEYGLRLLTNAPAVTTAIAWRVVYISAFIGSYSHVLLDSFMHPDIQPFYPLYLSNHLLGVIPTALLHQLCLYAGLIGAAVYYALQWRCKQSPRDPH